MARLHAPKERRLTSSPSLSGRSSSFAVRPWGSPSFTQRLIQRAEGAVEQGSIKPTQAKENLLKNTFNRPRAEQHYLELLKRIKGIPQFDNPTFIQLFRNYIDNGLATEDREQATRCLNLILNYLDKVKAFQVGRQFFVVNSADQEIINKAAQRQTQFAEVWSKLEMHLSVEKAERKAGVSLESSMGGSLFDGLDFGSYYDFLKPYWQEISTRYVRNLRGVVHCRMLIGITNSSVLYRTEWPIIRNLIQKKQVDKLVVHVFKSDDNGNITQSGIVEVKDQSDFDRLPSISSDFWDQQAKVRAAETAKHTANQKLIEEQVGYREEHRRKFMDALREIDRSKSVVETTDKDDQR